MAIKCPKCQRDNPPDAVFCAHCAAPLPSFPGLTETAPTPLVRELDPVPEVGPFPGTHLPP